MVTPLPTSTAGVRDVAGAVPGAGFHITCGLEGAARAVGSASTAPGIPHQVEIV